MVPVCDKRYHIYNRFRHFWAEIKKLWNYPLQQYYKCIHFTNKLFFFVVVLNIIIVGTQEYGGSNV